MGFFDSITSVFSTAAKAVSTGGISLIAPKIIPSFINKPLNMLTAAQFPSSFKSALGTGLAVATRNPSMLASNFSPYTPQGAQPMALNLGGILGQVGNVFGGNQNPYFQGISNVANLAGAFVPQPSAQPVAMRLPGSQVGPAIGRSLGPAIGRRFFDKYPNLATAMTQLRARGFKIKRSQLWNLLKRFGPELLITGGLLTAAAISELMMAGPGRHRMNPGNVKALRRSMRRIQSFHKLCQTADTLRRPRGRTAKGGKGCATQFVRQG